MKNFVIFTSVVLSLIEYVLCAEEVVAKGGDCRFNHKCEEGTYCVVEPHKDNVNEFICTPPRTEVGSYCYDLSKYEEYYHYNPPCGNGLKCLRITTYYKCVTDEAQREQFEAEKKAELARRYPCQGLIPECGEGGYCIRTGSRVNCGPPSQEGQPCEEKITADYIEKHNIGRKFYYFNAPCAEGLVCSEDKEVCVKNNSTNEKP